MRTTYFFKFTGGENLVDPVITMDAGELHHSMNYENSSNDGYRRVDGFERFDGHPSPEGLDPGNYPDLDAWEAAVEAARVLILPLPGSGVVRGIWKLRNEIYGFRDNAAGTACVMYKATPTGWVGIDTTFQLNFTAGANKIVRGDTITGGASGATGVIAYVLNYTGAWADGDAAGKLTIVPGTLTGTFQAGEDLTVGGTTAAVNTAAQKELTFPPGGTYEFINYNFYGHTSRQAMFGANGVGKGFTYDGESLWFLDTGMTIDKPTHVYAFKNHLFFSFEGGSIQHSSIGAPHEWNAITGASEMAIGDEITGFANVPGDTLAVFARNKIDLLYGTSSANWNIKTYSIDAGAIEGSVQTMDVPFFLGDRGVKRLSTTQEYGDFTMNTISQKVKPLLDQLKKTLLFSMRVRKKDQYRMFFSDGTVLILALDLVHRSNTGIVKGITKANYGHYDTNANFIEKIFQVGVSVNEQDGDELLFVGDNHGYVYKMDSSNSFDGDEVVAYIRPVFYHYGSPEHVKRFFKVTLELLTAAPFKLTFIPEFSYGDPYLPVAYEKTVEIRSGVGLWDLSYWENFYWDSQSLSTAYGYLTGIGRNFRFSLKSVCKYEEPHTIQGATVHYSRKGLKK